MTHRELSESAAAYALGALDEDESAAFASHLEGCADCRAKVDAFRQVVGALGHAVPAAQPADS
ncbi:MAG: zf-HC2 domain-containing protein, partial [Longimicrobiales bacterium]